MPDPSAPLPEAESLDEFPPPFAGLEVEIGAVALGTSRLVGASLDATIDLLEAAADAGVTLIETADVWGFDLDGATDASPDGEPGSVGPGFGAVEELLGQVFVEVPDLRNRLVLSTKGGVFPPLPYDSSADYLRQACEASLYRMGVDVIDLYQVHRPDLLAHPEEVAEVLTDLRAAGKVREVGVANHSSSQIQALQSFLDFPLVSAQMRFSALQLGALVDGTLDLAMEFGLTPLAWSPFGGGDLVGVPKGKKAVVVAEVCDRIAAEQDTTRAAVLLAWLMHHPAGVIPIVATSSVVHLRECAAAAEVGFSRQQWYEVLIAARGQAMP